MRKCHLQFDDLTAVETEKITAFIEKNLLAECAGDKNSTGPSGAIDTTSILSGREAV
jgi:hypothetical protein